MSEQQPTNGRTRINPNSSRSLLEFLYAQHSLANTKASSRPFNPLQYLALHLAVKSDIAIDSDIGLKHLAWSASFDQRRMTGPHRPRLHACRCHGLSSTLRSNPAVHDMNWSVASNGARMRTLRAPRGVTRRCFAFRTVRLSSRR